MSTEYGYVCRSHQPNLRSEQWFHNARGAEILRWVFEIERAGQWPSIPEMAYPPDQWDPAPVEDATAAPIHWLRLHRGCDVAIVDEYGVVASIERGAALS